MTNTTFHFIDKFAGQLRYIPNRFSIDRVPAINSLSLSFLVNCLGVGGGVGNRRLRVRI